MKGAIKAIPILAIVAASGNAYANAGPIGSQFHVDSIAQLLFMGVFMVVFALVIGLLFGVLGAIGEGASSLIGAMRTKQFEAQSKQRAMNERLDRLFPPETKPDPDWCEVRDEIAQGNADIASIWRTYHDAKRGSLSEAEFAARYDRWCRDPLAQHALIPKIERTWDAAAERKCAQAFDAALSAIRNSGDLKKHIPLLRDIAQWARLPRYGKVSDRAIPAFEMMLSVLAPERERDEWLNASCGLARALSASIAKGESGPRTAATLARVCEIYERVLRAVPKTYADGDLANEQSWISVRGEHAYALLRHGRNNRPDAAAQAEKAYAEILAVLPAGVAVEHQANTKMNLARAAETQGDGTTGANAREHFLRARALYQNALAFRDQHKLPRTTRTDRNLERIESKLAE